LRPAGRSQLTDVTGLGSLDLSGSRPGIDADVGIMSGRSFSGRTLDECSAAPETLNATSTFARSAAVCANLHSRPDLSEQPSASLCPAHGSDQTPLVNSSGRKRLRAVANVPPSAPPSESRNVSAQSTVGPSDGSHERSLQRPVLGSNSVSTVAPSEAQLHVAGLNELASDTDPSNQRLPLDLTGLESSSAEDSPQVFAS